ncbi:hypothetical protein DRO61_11155, partial [Candidatus Bathyarchaeota archaeon]
MTNIVYIAATNGMDKNFSVGIESWKNYCNRIGSRLIVSTNNLPENNDMEGNGSWQPWISNNLKNENFDRVLIADIDMVVRETAPNIFDSYPDTIFGAVKDVSGIN